MPYDTFQVQHYDASNHFGVLFSKRSILTFLENDCYGCDVGRERDSVCVREKEGEKEGHSKTMVIVAQVDNSKMGPIRKIVTTHEKTKLYNFPNLVASIHRTLASIFAPPQEKNGFRANEALLWCILRLVPS